MLSLMRKHAGTWMIKLILGAIVVVFVFWGVGSYTSQRSVRVASINGDGITLDEYRSSYNRLLNQMKRNFGNNLNDEMIKSLGLEKQALDQLIDRRLMLQAAEELDIRVPDTELAASIREIEAFQAAGNFDPRRYRQVLGLNRISPEEFEANQRQDLAIAKMNSLITSSAKVSDLEIESVYKSENASVEVAYLFFDPSKYDQITPSAEEVAAYFDENKQAYKTEPMRKVRYLHFNPKSYEAKVEVNDEEISDYYENNIDKFEEAKTVEARHILIKVAQDASAEEDQKARERIEEILKMARTGQDFGELAKKYSEGPSKDRGGQLGAFRREVMVKPFADKAFSTAAGEISDPVRTQFGWHIIKVEKVNPAKTKTLAEAKQEIRKQLVDERAKYMAADEAEAVYESIFDGEQLDSVAQARNLTLSATDFFDRRGPQEKEGNGFQFAQTAFDLPVGDISEIKDLGDGYYLIQVDEEKPAQIPELDAVMEKVKADLSVKLGRDAAAKDARAALAMLKEGAEMDDVAAKYGLTPKTTGYFKRGDAIAEIGSEAAISTAAFGLSEETKWPEDVVEIGKGFFVLEYRGGKDADMANFEESKDAIRQRLLQRKQYQAVEAWLQNQKENSEIVIEPNFQTS